MTNIAVQFRKAEKKKAKLRLALIAPSGYGKTFSSLQIAQGMGGKVAMIDTENGSGDLYADRFEYDIITMNAPYLAEKYVAAIKAAEAAGYDTLIIDSLSHAWSGEGGLLDQQGKIADSGKGNSWTAWRTITPKHNLLVETILGAKLHIIATMRAKSEYVIETDDRGKQVPKKIGLAPIQRDGVEYEFTVVMDLDKNHYASPSKDRTSLFDGQFVKMDEAVGKQLVAWLEGASDAPQTSTEDGKTPPASPVAPVQGIQTPPDAPQDKIEPPRRDWLADAKLVSTAAEAKILMDDMTAAKESSFKIKTVEALLKGQVGLN
jgi:hypothetical protein